MDRKCPTCPVAMTEGFIPDRGLGAEPLAMFVEGPPQFGVVGNVKLTGVKRYPLTAYRCPKCD